MSDIILPRPPDIHGYDSCGRCQADLTKPGTRVVRFWRDRKMAHYCMRCWSLVPNQHEWHKTAELKVREQ